MDLDTLGYFLYMEKQEAKEKELNQTERPTNAKEQEQQDNNKSRG